MKRFFLVCFAAVICACLFSCSHKNMQGVSHNSMIRASQAGAVVTSGSITTESAEVWARPLEIGFVAMGEAEEGTAETAVGDTSLGEDENYLVTNVFIDPQNKSRTVVQTGDYSDLLKRAIINAMKKRGADGFYVTMYEIVREDTDKVNYTGAKTKAKIKKTAWVRGIPLRMVIHDDKISYEKARTHKFCDRFCVERDTCPAACIFPKYELDTLKMEFDNKSKDKKDSNVELKMEINGKQNTKN